MRECPLRTTAKMQTRELREYAERRGWTAAAEYTGHP